MHLGRFEQVRRSPSRGGGWRPSMNKHLLVVHAELGPHDGPGARPDGRSGSPTGTDRHHARPSWPVVAESAGRASYEACDTATSRSPLPIEARSNARFTSFARSQRLCSVYTTPGRVGAGSEATTSCPNAAAYGRWKWTTSKRPLTRSRRSARHPPQIGVVDGAEGSAPAFRPATIAGTSASCSRRT